MCAQSPARSASMAILTYDALMELGEGMNRECLCHSQIKPQEHCHIMDTTSSCQERRQPRTERWLVQVEQLQFGQPAYITIVHQPSTNDAEHPTANASMASAMETTGKHQGVRRSRPCKGKRRRYKQFVESLQIQISEDPEYFDFKNVAFPPNLRDNAKKREILIRQMQNFHTQVKQASAGQLFGVGLSL